MVKDTTLMRVGEEGRFALLLAVWIVGGDLQENTQTPRSGNMWVISRRKLDILDTRDLQLTFIICEGLWLPK